MILRTFEQLRFDEALGRLGGRVVAGTPPTCLDELTEDSREVVAGGGFVARRGASVDGHRYIEAALAAGARVVLCEQAPEEAGALVEGRGAAIVELERLGAHLPALARNVYGDPTRRLKLVAVTGTNGKTTTTHIIEAIGQALGYAVGVIGTIAYRWPGQVLPAPNTTPGVLTLSRLLRRMLDDGVAWVALEASSHGLALGRLAALRFDAAVWTQFGRDHLDFHGTLEGYRDAKLRLFDGLLEASREAGKPAVAIVNAEDATARDVFSAPARCQRLGERLRWYCTEQGPPVGCGEAQMLRARDLRFDEGGVRGELTRGGWRRGFSLPLLGRFNLLNALGALEACVALGASGAQACEALARVARIPGRMEAFGGGDAAPLVVVDYAHTPEALESVLTTLREMTRGSLIAVFGAGGDRDRDKRPLMGSTVARLADRGVITNDNPRSEPPGQIIDAILGGIAPTARERFEVVADRGEAIGRAVREAAPGDVVLIAGKGHEQTQVIGGLAHPFDDRQRAREALRDRDPASV